MTHRVIVSLARDFAPLGFISLQLSVVTGDILLSVVCEHAPSPRPQSAPESLLAGYAVSNPWTSIPFGGRENTEHPVFFPTRHPATSFPVFFPLSFCVLALNFFILSEQINDKSKKSDDESEDEDDPAKLQKKRDWDEWKDG